MFNSVGSDSQLSTSQINACDLFVDDGREARLLIKAVQCHSFPNQHYWIFRIQVIILPTNIKPALPDFFRDILQRATEVSSRMSQTQYWCFGPSDIRLIGPEAVGLDPFDEEHSGSGTVAEALDWDTLNAQLDAAILQTSFTHERQTVGAMASGITQGGAHDGLRSRKRKTAHITSAAPHTPAPMGRVIKPLPKRLPQLPQRETQLDARMDWAPDVVGQNLPDEGQDLQNLRPTSRVDILVRAVIEGTRKFQDDVDRRNAWVSQFQVKLDMCNDVEALHAQLLKSMNAAVMNHWISHFLYGCSHILVSRTTSKRRRITAAGQPSRASRASSVESEASTDTWDVESEAETGETSSGEINKRYRCRKLARIVIKLMNCLIERLDGEDAAEEAFSILPALAVADCGFSQSSLKGWSKDNIDEWAADAARMLLRPANDGWRRIGSQFRMDPAKACRTKHTTDKQVRESLGLKQGHYSQIFDEHVDDTTPQHEESNPQGANITMQNEQDNGHDANIFLHDSDYESL